jgi:DNA-binding NarL/FixJ family response regulator
MERRAGGQHTAGMETAPPATRLLDVFIIEDSLEIRDRLVALLDPIAGARIVGHAASADEAIAAITSRRPDTVVLDLNLKKGSGIDVLRALRADARDIEVYVLTNFATPQYRRACLALGARGFFDKSAEFEKVRDAITARAQKAPLQVPPQVQ